jgi:hypothetical protein
VDDGAVYELGRRREVNEVNIRLGLLAALISVIYVESLAYGDSRILFACCS